MDEDRELVPILVEHLDRRQLEIAAAAETAANTAQPALATTPLNSTEVIPNPEPSHSPAILDQPSSSRSWLTVKGGIPAACAVITVLEFRFPSRILG